MPAHNQTEQPKGFGITSKVIKRFRYYCQGCTERVLYAPQPFKFTYQVCPNCQKVHDQSNYDDQNWLPMSEEEIQEINLI